MCDIRWFYGGFGAFWSRLWWIVGSFLVSLGQEVTVTMRDNEKYLTKHGWSHIDSLNVLSLNKYAFEDILSACWLFFIDNLSHPSLHPLLMAVTVKPPRGKFLVQETQIYTLFSDEHSIILNRREEGHFIRTPLIWEKGSGMFSCKNERELLKISKYLNWVPFKISLT